MTYSRLSGVGSYLPERILTNQELATKVATSDEWIVSRTGIHQRHIAADHETAATMAAKSSQQALSMAGIPAEAVELIIVATTTPDYQFPGAAVLLQDLLGASECIAFDLNACACAGFIYGLSIADQYIKSGMVKNALVVGSEVMSRIIDWSDRTTCVLFGDGAGAVVLTAADAPGIIATHLQANGKYKDILFLDHQHGISHTTSQRPSHTVPSFLQMQGNALYKVAVQTLGKLFDDTLQKNNLQLGDINWLVPHQANIRIIESMATKLHLPLERVAITLDQHGNTSSASIPLALDVYMRSHRIQAGDLLLLEGFGGGLSWGSALIKL